MKKKIMGAVEAITQGVNRVILANANVKQPIVSALDGGGTHIYASTTPLSTLAKAANE